MNSKLNRLNAALIGVLLVAAVTVHAGNGQAASNAAFQQTLTALVD